MDWQSPSTSGEAKSDQGSLVKAKEAIKRKADGEIRSPKPSRRDDEEIGLPIWSEIFKKRDGTTNAGINYEHSLTAYIILKLVEDNNIEDFWLSSNDEAFGSFDDVVVKVKYRNSRNTVTYAIQLKHKDKDTLTTEQLARKEDVFSINKYFKDYCKLDSLKKDSIKMILFTNCKFYENSNFLLTLNNKVYDVKVSSNQSDELISTTPKECSFTFESNEENTGFLKKFFLYASQLTVGVLKKSCLDKFKTMFSCGESIFYEYFNFIVEWSLIKGEKKKLNKEWMRRMILVRVLSPFVQTLSFKEKPLHPKVKILHKAVSAFQITLLQKDSYKQLNWEIGKINVNIKQFIKTCEKYQITTNCVKGISELTKEDVKATVTLTEEDVEANKILWLMEKRPLVIEADKPGVKRTLDLLVRDEKFIILTSNLNEEFVRWLKRKENACFECLSDLKNAKRVYNEVLDTFTVSIEDQKEATLREVINEVQNVEEYFKTNTLVRLAVNPSLCRKNYDSDLPKYYIERMLTRTFIDSKYLKEFHKDTLVVLTHITKMEPFKQWCQGNNIFAIDFSLPCKRTTEIQPNMNVIYVTTENCSQQQFDELCKKHEKSKCHQFKYVSSEQIEWTRSKSGVSELRQYQLKDTEYIHESELLIDSNNNLINIICEKPQTGKTSLIKKLKSATPSTCWTILIFAENCAKYLIGKENDVEKFLECIVKSDCKDYTNLDKIILSNFLKNSNIQIVWDGLDESSSETLKIIMKMISELNKKGLRQWLISQTYLTDKLEQQFDVFSRRIKEFNEEEQENYIKNCLNYVNERSSTILSKIKSKINLLSNNNILGNPLEISMLAGLLKNEKILCNVLDPTTCTIADLYKYFVGERIHKHYSKKYDIKGYLKVIMTKKKTKEDINKYKTIAIRHYLEFDLDIADNYSDLLLQLKKNKDPIGFIIKVTEDLKPQFYHDSYGKYFAALYLSGNDKMCTKFKDSLPNGNYDNINCFLDGIRCNS